MKQFLSAAVFGLATLFSLPGQAQSLREDATKEQIAAKLGIEKGQPEADLGDHLCFDDLRNKGFGVIRLEKVANFFGALEDAGLRLDRAFAETDCGEKMQPLRKVFGYVNAPYSLIQRVIVQALALHAERTGKGDDWLLRILTVKDKEGQSLYTSREESGRKTPLALAELERDYRTLLGTFSALEIALFGKSGLELDIKYFESFYTIEDMDNFLGVTGCTQFLHAERRATWVELARRHARGEFEPRGMVQNMDLAAMQNCLKVPNMEAKVAAVAPSLLRHEHLAYLKRNVKFELSVMESVHNAQPKLCPPQVPAVRAIAYCATDYERVYVKLKRMVDNEASGYTVRELDSSQ